MGDSKVQDNGGNLVESVVDPGSSIIAMSEEVCHKLGLAYDPSIHIPLQSANSGIDYSLGLAQNMPCEVSSTTLYMQIHIICDPAYDILLAWPFNILTESSQELLKRNPNYNNFQSEFYVILCYPYNSQI